MVRAEIFERLIPPLAAGQMPLKTMLLRAENAQERHFTTTIQMGPMRSVMWQSSQNKWETNPFTLQTLTKDSKVAMQHKSHQNPSIAAEWPY